MSRKHASRGGVRRLCEDHRRSGGLYRDSRIRRATPKCDFEYQHGCFNNEMKSWTTPAVRLNRESDMATFPQFLLTDGRVSVPRRINVFIKRMNLTRYFISWSFIRRSKIPDWGFFSEPLIQDFPERKLIFSLR